MSRDDETVGETVQETVRGDTVDVHGETVGENDTVSPNASTAVAPPSRPSGGRRSSPNIKSEGTRLGRYTIRKLLGRGGMGAVYEADDEELARRVALKVLREDRDNPTEALRREAQALARLVHQNVVMVYDVGVQGDEVFLVMQLVEGMTIDAWIAKHKPPAETILKLFEQAGLGLAAAHAVGLVHCDFKPSNVFVDEKGIARVGDFGLARAAKSGGVAPVVSLEPMSEMTTVAGTPAYMAPEQFSGVVASASDQFAFCVALWECLAGERPYADSTAPALELESRGARRPLPRGANVPRHVMKALDRGMARDPSHRFPSMAALLEGLKPPSRTALVASITAIGGLAIGGLVAYLVLARDEAEPWNSADVARSQALTSYGKDACAYALTFDAGGRLIFDFTKGDVVDLYEQPIAGGAPRQLTTAESTWEWRAQPGRKAGEVIHLVHDPEDPAKSHVGFLDIGSGTSTKAFDGMEWDAVVVGDTIYYTAQRAGGILAFTQGVHRPFLTPEGEESFFLLSASPKGDRIAVSKTRGNGAGGQPCIVDIRSRKLTCLAYETVSRPVWSPDGTALYFGTYDGIVRHEIVTNRSMLVVPGMYSEGVAVSPRGEWLVYSTCFAHTNLQKLATGEVVIASERVTYATESAQGVMAWVEDQRGVRVLMVRMADGQDRQITTAANGNADAPAFSPDGRRIVFAASQPAPGLRIADLDNPGVIHQVTSEPRDRTPVWTSNNLIAFTRGDSSENEQAFVITPDGHDLRLLAERTRTVYGNRKHELLVGGNDAMYWLDPATGVERPGPKRPKGQLFTATVSPNGEWVGYQVGPLGGEIWRVHGDAEPELLRTMQGIEYADSLLVRDSGEILFILGRYYGDLVRVPARAGARF